MEALTLSAGASYLMEESWPLSSLGNSYLIEEIQPLSSGRPLVSLMGEAHLVLSLKKPHLTASAFAPCLPGLIHGEPWSTGNSHRESWAEYWARLPWGREEGGALEGLPWQVKVTRKRLPMWQSDGRRWLAVMSTHWG